MRRLPLLLSDSSFTLGIVKPGTGHLGGGGRVGGWGVVAFDSLSLKKLRFF